ncbi:MAG: sulfatase [Alphaproteobacteria bacterium]|nr:sulfatase [Alphaproteobacteria bacterium]
MRKPVIAGVALALVAGAGWWWSTVAPQPRHLVVITIDTLRADALPLYGHPTTQAPTLQALADEAVVFEQAISVAPTTLASHTALFTGNPAHTHGVPRNDYRVDDANRMLPEVLHDAGFHSAAFIGAIPIASHSNFTQGFDEVDEHFSLNRTTDGVAQTMRTATEVTDAVLAWLDGRESAERTMLFVHYFDVHAPYEPPDAYADLYDIPSQFRKIGSMRGIARTRKALNRSEPEAAERNEATKQLYQAGISYVDHELGRLLDALRDDGMLDDALLVITADHGETYATHDELWDHGQTVYDETVHVPLIVRLPGGWHGGRRVTDQVSSIDLFASALELLGVPVEPNEGVTWVPALRGLPLRDDRPPAFSEATKPHYPHNSAWQNDPMQKAIRQDGYKLVDDPRTKQRALYDLNDDPGELNDLRAHDVPRTQSLLDRLEAWRAAAAPLPSERITSERVQAELAALGYVEALEGGEDGDDDGPPDTDGD